MTRQRWLVALIFVIAGCGGSSGSSGSAPSSSPTGSQSPSPSQTVVVKETEFSLDPNQLTLKPGTYVFKAESDGKFPHDLHIVDAGGQEVGATSAILKPGDKADVTATLKAGNYTMFCAVDSHRARGMEGTIKVQG